MFSPLMLSQSIRVSLNDLINLRGRHILLSQTQLHVSWFQGQNDVNLNSHMTKEISTVGDSGIIIGFFNHEKHLRFIQDIITHPHH